MADRCTKEELREAGHLTIDKEALDVELSILLVTIDNRILAIMAEELFAWRASGEIGDGILGEIANQINFKVKPPWTQGDHVIRYFETIILNEVGCRFLKVMKTIENTTDFLRQLHEELERRRLSLLSITF